jgi:lipoprotein-releasing system permease protein
MNNTSLSSFIAIRYLRSKKSNSSISFFSVVSLFGVSLGLAAIIVVISVMNGFENEMQRRILGMLPHLSVENRLDNRQTSQKISLSNWSVLASNIQSDYLFQSGELKGQLLAASPFVHLDGMLNKNGLVKGIRVVGVESQFQKQTSVLNEFILAGSLHDLTEGSHNIILGSDIARELGIIVGDNIILVFPRVVGNSKRLQANYYNFSVIGFFDVGAEADGLLAFVNIADAAQLKYQSNTIDGFRFKLKDVYSAEKFENPLKNYYSNQYTINTWASSYGQLFQTVKIEKIMTASMLMLIVLVAAFNTVSSLSMLVAEKHTGIAVLRTMGFSQRNVVLIFFLQGLMTSGGGVLLGLIVGVLVALNLGDMIIWFNHFEIFWIAPLKSEVRLMDVVWISLLALLLSLTASIIPAFNAAKIQPADAVRYH